MLDRLNPVAMLVAGGVLVVAGALIPFLMVMQVLKSTYAMNFLAYGASFLGLMLGVAGSALHVRNQRRKNKQ